MEPIDVLDPNSALESVILNTSEIVELEMDVTRNDTNGRIIWTTLVNVFVPYSVMIFSSIIAYDLLLSLGQTKDITSELSFVISGIIFFLIVIHRYSITMGIEKLYSSFSLEKLTLAVILPMSIIIVVDFLGSIPLGIIADILFPSGMEQITIYDDSSLTNPVYLSLLFITIVIIAPITEELAFRGLILDYLNHNYGKWPAIIVSSILFGVIHIIPAAIVVATFGGLLYGWLRIKTDSLWPGILCHSLWNSFVFVMMFLI